MIRTYIDNIPSRSQTRDHGHWSGSKTQVAGSNRKHGGEAIKPEGKRIQLVHSLAQALTLTLNRLANKPQTTSTLFGLRPDLLDVLLLELA